MYWSRINEGGSLYLQVRVFWGTNERGACTYMREYVHWCACDTAVRVYTNIYTYEGPQLLPQVTRI